MEPLFAKITFKYLLKKYSKTICQGILVTLQVRDTIYH